MLQYPQKLIPTLADKAVPLRNLLKQDTAWLCTEEQSAYSLCSSHTNPCTNELPTNRKGSLGIKVWLQEIPLVRIWATTDHRDWSLSPQKLKSISKKHMGRAPPRLETSVQHIALYAQNCLQARKRSSHRMPFESRLRDKQECRCMHQRLESISNTINGRRCRRRCRDGCAVWWKSAACCQHLFVVQKRSSSLTLF